MERLRPPPFCKPHVIIEREGKSIAIFGLITPDTPVLTHPKNVVGLTFLDPIETAAELVPKLQPKADVIIALTHIGYNMDRQLGEEVGGINVIVGGHSHAMISVPERLGTSGGNAIIRPCPYLCCFHKLCSVQVSASFSVSVFSAHIVASRF